MTDVDSAILKQLENIQSKTSKTLGELYEYLSSTGIDKHSEMRAQLQKEFGLGYGDANMLALQYKKQSSGSTAGDPLDTIYAGNNAPLRTLHDALITKIKDLSTFEIAPKKSYVSLRVNKQFLTVGPGSKQRLELGFNIRKATPTAGLDQLPDGGMCQYRAYISQESDIDDALLANIQLALSEAN